jgi:protein involved in polysaccharide export with SLBB domain
MTLGDVLALAGGATSQGQTNSVQLFRDGHQVTGRLSSSTPVGESLMRSGDQLVVPERSWMSRNPGVVVAGVGSAVSVTIALVRLIAFHR